MSAQLSFSLSLTSIAIWLILLAFILPRELFRSRAWYRKHQEKVKTFEFWKARCDEAWRAYDEAPEHEKDAKWRAYTQCIGRYEKEVMLPLWLEREGRA